ncbi:MAG TPA: M20 family metallopeptidase [Chloroflexia bacterium]|nr:M20 family metallopeptidase [Chloroflexia bacterium]
MNSTSSEVFSREAAIELTQALVRIPSENPTGDEVAVGQYIAEWLRDHDIETEVRPVEGARANVLGRVRGAGGPPLVLIAHLDTVPIGDHNKWKHDPFGGQIEGNLLYGRGSCDMKSGAAAAMVALARIKESGVKLSGDLILACTVDEEEAYMKGSHALGKEQAVPSNAYLLTMEPTGCKLNTAQKGAYWFEVTFLGKGAHAANPQIGIDANRAMAEAILGWYDAAEKMGQSMPAPHPLLGMPTLIVSRLAGGVKTNIVSEVCRCEIDMRVPPPFKGNDVRSLIEDVCRSVATKYGVEFVVRHQSADRPPVECQEGSPLLAAFDQAYQDVTGQEAEHLGFLAYTDAAMLAVLTENQQAVVFGPGLLSDAHTTDEKVELDQIVTATDILEKTALHLLGEK